MFHDIRHLYSSALYLNILFISPGLHKTKHSKLQRIQCIYQAWFPQEPLVLRVRSCLPPAFLPGFPGRLTSPIQGLLLRGYSLWNHTQQSPTHGSFIHVFWLGPSPSFHHIPLHPLWPLSVCSIPTPLVLFFLLVSFVY